jgi:large subunit ribosomal protein L21
MFAVIRTGGKQYRVAPNDIIEIEKIAGKLGDIVELSEVILLSGDGGPKTGKTGSPTIEGAMVAAEVIEQKRGDKIIVFKKKRRKNYRRKNGHRQALTALRITEILTDGKKPSKQAARPEPKKAEKKAAEAEAKSETATSETTKSKTKPAAKKAEAKQAAKKPAAKAAKAAKPAAKKPAPKPKKK